MTIGARVRIQTGCYVTAFSEIEDDVFVAPCVTTTNDNTMGRHPPSPEFSLRGATLRRACRVGAGVVLLPGVEIGEEAFVAAGARRHARRAGANARDGRARAEGARGGGRRADRAMALKAPSLTTAAGARRRASRRRVERRTQMLGALALTTTVAAIAAEFGRVWRRGSAPLPQEAERVLQASSTAAAETVQVAVAGYQEVSAYQRALFNLFASFLISFGSARGLAAPAAPPAPRAVPSGTSCSATTTSTTSCPGSC